MTTLQRALDRIQSNNNNEKSIKNALQVLQAAALGLLEESAKNQPKSKKTVREVEPSAWKESYISALKPHER
jgi:hypothetical protein